MARTKNKRSKSQIRRSKSQNRRSKLNNRKTKRVLRGGMNSLETESEIVIYVRRPFDQIEAERYVRNYLTPQANNAFLEGDAKTIKISNWIQMFQNGLQYNPNDGGAYQLRVLENYHIDGGLPEPTPPYLEIGPLDKPVFRGHTLFRGDIINKVETNDGGEGSEYRVLTETSQQQYMRKLLSAPYIKFTLDKEAHNRLAEQFKEKYKPLAIAYYQNKKNMVEIKSLESLVKKLAQKILDSPARIFSLERTAELKESIEQQIEEIHETEGISDRLHEFASIMKKLNKWKEGNLNDDQIKILIREGVIRPDSVAKNTLDKIEEARSQKKKYFQEKLNVFLTRTKQYEEGELKAIIDKKL